MTLLALTPDSQRIKHNFGVYVHIPFCAKRCDYCDFATWTDKSHIMDDYVEACVQDISKHYATGEFPKASSVFFGGGTPSLLPAELLCDVLRAIPRKSDAEVTVECNPESADLEKLQMYLEAGVTRLSFGMQSAVPHVLEKLGRQHSEQQLEWIVGSAHELGYKHLSVDLIYGTNGESLKDWQRSLETAVALPIDHISAYALTVESGTPLARNIAEGKVGAPDDDDQATKYEVTDQILNEAGFEWYEISNWARPNGECRHNLGYWNERSYLGIGCAAHGYTKQTRWWNVRSPERYIAAVAEGRSPRADEEALNEMERDFEAVGLMLRLSDGLLLARSSKYFENIMAVLPELQEAELIDVQYVGVDVRITLSLQGRRLANEVIARLGHGAEIEANTR